MMLLLVGSAEMSEHDVCESRYSTFFQVTPPSPVRYTPRSSLGPHSRPSTQAYTMSALRESITRRAILSDFSSPIFVQ